MGLPTGFPVMSARLGGACGTDRWSSGFWVSFGSGVSTLAQGDLDAFVALILSTFQAQVWGPASNPLKNVNATGVTLDSCQATYYTGGLATFASRQTQTPVAGTSSSTSIHAAAALVATLQTDQSNRRTRGRMYLPATAPNGSGSTLQWSVAPPLAAQMKAVFDVVNAASLAWDSGNTHRVAVVSRAGSGGARSVQRVRVDSVIDSQRGRSDKFVPTFTSTSTLA